MPPTAPTVWRTLVARRQAPLETGVASACAGPDPERFLVVVRSSPQRARLLPLVRVPVVTLSELFGLAGGEEIRDEDLVPDALLDRIVAEALPPHFTAGHRRHLASETRRALHLLAASGVRPETLEGRGDLMDALRAAHEALTAALPRLHAQGLFTADERVLFAASRPSRFTTRFPTVRQVLLLGIDTLSPMEREALVAITKDVPEVVAHVVGETPGTAHHAALAFTRPLITWLAERGPVLDIDDGAPRTALLSRFMSDRPRPPVALPGVHITSAHDPDDEIEAAVLRVAQLLEAGAPAHGIAIVVPRLAEVGCLLTARLSELGIPYATSHPGATRATPSGTFLRLVLETLRDGLPADKVLDLVAHPLASFVHASGDVQVRLKGEWLRERLARIGRTPRGLAAWDEALAALDRPFPLDRDDRHAPRWEPWHEAQRQGLAALLLDLERLRRARDAETFFDGLRALLDRANIGRGVARATRRVRDPDRLIAGHARTLALLDETEDALRLDEGRADTPDAIEALLVALWREPLPPQGDTAFGVQVLGWRNARGLRFEHVLVLGAHQDALPPPDRDRGLRRALERACRRPLDRIDPELEARRILHGLIADTDGTVVLSSPRHEDDAELPRSVLLDEIEDVFLLDPAPPILDAPRTARTLQRRAAMSGLVLAEPSPADIARRALVVARDRGEEGAWSGHIGPTLAERVPLVPADRPLAVTTLGTYAACPLRHLLTHGLGARLPRTRDGDLDGLDRGQLIHAILHDYVQQATAVHGVPFRVADDKEAERRMLRVATEHLAALPLASVPWDAFKIALLGGLADASNPYRNEPPGLLARFLAEERASGARILATESAFGTDRPVLVTTDAGAIAIQGRIDRIDLMDTDDGPRLRVVDYKTGTIPPKALAHGGVDQQLPLYLHAARTMYPEHVPGAALYYQVARPDRSHFGPRPPHLPRPDEALDRFLDVTMPERLTELARAARAGWFPLTLLDEEEAGCHHCDHRRGCGLRPHLQSARRHEQLAREPRPVEERGPLPDRVRELP